MSACVLFFIRYSNLTIVIYVPLHVYRTGKHTGNCGLRILRDSVDQGKLAVVMDQLNGKLSLTTTAPFALQSTLKGVHVKELNGGYSQNGAGRGLRGTFAHGSMLDVWLVECGREKLTFGELLFAPFA